MHFCSSLFSCNLHATVVCLLFAPLNWEEDSVTGKKRWRYFSFTSEYKRPGHIYPILCSLRCLEYTLPSCQAMSTLYHGCMHDGQMVGQSDFCLRGPRYDPTGSRFFCDVTHSIGYSWPGMRVKCIQYTVDSLLGGICACLDLDIK